MEEINTWEKIQWLFSFSVQFLFDLASSEYVDRRESSLLVLGAWPTTFGNQNSNYIDVDVVRDLINKDGGASAEEQQRRLLHDHSLARGQVEQEFEELRPKVITVVVR